MKKLLLFAFTLAMVACNNDNDKQDRKWLTLDFEDMTIVADNPSTWSYVTEGYSWNDATTQLAHEAIFTTDYGYTMFSGGLIVSGYNSNDVVRFGTYESDLYAYNASNSDSTKGGGANGSNRFLISFGNFDPAFDPDLDLRPEIKFSDGKARAIKGCQVNSTTYFVNITQNGNPFSPAMKDGEEIKIYATGYDAAGREGKSVSMTIARKGNVIKEWTSWDLLPLGEVVSVKFNIKGGNTDEWGMTTPKYFAIDNIVVEDK